MGSERRQLLIADCEFRIAEWKSWRSDVRCQRSVNRKSARSDRLPALFPRSETDLFAAGSSEQLLIVNCEFRIADWKSRGQRADGSRRGQKSEISSRNLRSDFFSEQLFNLIAAQCARCDLQEDLDDLIIGHY